MLRPLVGLTVAFGLNPVTRVAQLLQGLSDKLEADSKTETKLYEDFVCWCKTIERTKTQSNEVATQRIKDLEAYIDDIKNGRVEFTTERQDLAKEISELNNQLEEEKATRDAARKAFEENDAEMKAAKAALEEAITVLASATENSKEGVLLGVRFALKKAFLNSKGKNEHLEYVESMINKALKTSDVPTNKEWDKMDEGKTTFNKKYKGRSFKIQDMLAEMKQTFTDNIEQAQKDEDEAEKNYETLRAKKEETLNARKEAAASLNAENGARNKTRAESEAEVDELKKQREADEKTLEETAATCKTKKDEYVERNRLRTEEVASIAEAINVLRSDDARDVFNASFESQASFLQVAKTPNRCEIARKQKAIKLLSEVHSDRAQALAFLTTQPSTEEFPGNVIEKIDAILADLEREGEQDETDKNDCEKLMATKEYEKKELKYSISDNNEEIQRQEALVVKLNESIEQKKLAVTAIKDEMKKADELRLEQAQEFAKSKSDDEMAISLLDKAIASLKKFYTDNNLALVQIRKHLQKGPGEAAAPPPKTWDDANYGGAKGEHQGVTSIMELIKQDVEKDIRTATKEEDDLISKHTKFTNESTEEVDTLNEQIDEATMQRTDAETTIKEQTDERDASQVELDATIALIETEKPRCDFITTNFQTRKENRAAEKDGLNKAKAVLKGAKFGFLEC